MYVHTREIKLHICWIFSNYYDSFSPSFFFFHDPSLSQDTFLLFGCFGYGVWLLSVWEGEEENLSSSVCCYSPVLPPPVTLALWLWFLPPAVGACVTQGRNRTALSPPSLLLHLLLLDASIKPSTYSIKVQPLPLSVHFCGTCQYKIGESQRRWKTLWRDVKLPCTP